VHLENDLAVFPTILTILFYLIAQHDRVSVVVAQCVSDAYTCVSFQATKLIASISFVLIFMFGNETALCLREMAIRITKFRFTIVFRNVNFRKSDDCLYA
jgi:hypothetical protein